MKSVNEIGVIVFTKVPKVSFVKTRLYHPQLDRNYVSKLQTAMLKDTLLMLGKIPINFVPILSFFPKEDIQTLERLIIKPLKPLISKSLEKYHVVPQKGETIVDRFTNVFSYAFNELNLGSVIIIGSDTPHLQPNLIMQSFKLLRQNINAAVLGPSQNGGFYLLGHNRPFIENIGDIFQKQSSLHELGSCMDLLNSKGHLVHIIPEVTDIDTFENLKSVRIIINILSLTSSESINSYYPRFTYQLLNSLEESFWVSH
ncbi:MAG: DUF2064 domain-containing protein [Candidatus Heimdallarchaeota archaeon]|nr:MAG: DUF2064 domain-containing protein [Candidatus Heimdallarchaeota archaeon]